MSGTGVTVGVSVEHDVERVPIDWHTTETMFGPTTYKLEVEVPGSTSYTYTELPNYSDAMEVLNQIMNNHPELRPKEKVVTATNTTNTPQFNWPQDDIDQKVAQKIQKLLGDVPDDQLADTLMERLPDNVLIEEVCRRLTARPYDGPDFSVYDVDNDRWDKVDGLWSCEGCGTDGEYTGWTWQKLFTYYDYLKDDEENVVAEDGTLV